MAKPIQSQARSSGKTLLLSCVAVLAVSSHASAQVAVEETRIAVQTGGRGGTNAAMSSDGTWAGVGPSIGAAISHRAGVTWTAESVPPGAPTSVSDDGSRAIVSYSVYLRSGSSWTLETTLIPFGSAWDYPVMARDGMRATGIPRSGGGAPMSPLVWARTGTTWALEATLPVTGAQVLAISNDGSRVAVGAQPGSFDPNVVVFARTGTSWALEATLPAGGGSTAHAIALSGDGAVLLVSLDNGGTYGWVRAGTSWTAATLTVPNANVACALDGTGTRALIGPRLYERTGLVWASSITLPTGALSHGGAAFDAAGLRVAVAQLGGTGNGVVYRLHDVGDPCGSGPECPSGFCPDGLCCTTACAGGSSDCQACSIAAGGTADGTCTTLSAAAAPATLCRASAGPCDVAETCTAGVVACPADAIVPNGGAVCRPASGTCDVPEVCNGSGVACPVDVFAPAATCRPAAGACDVAESCTGTSAACPPDAFHPSGHVCQPTTGDPCDLDDICNGSSATCPARFAASTALCGNPVPQGPCDQPDHCAGTSGDCVSEFLSGVTCRPSAGGCDPEETCLGDAPDCPPDRVEPAGMACRVSTDPSCDPAEACDGLEASCPADVTSCAARPDAGAPDGGADAGSSDGGGRDGGSDAGTTPAAATGCSCRIGARAPSLGLGVLAACLVVLARRKRTARVNHL